MKILVVTPSYPAPDDPQAGIFIHRQMANLVACGVGCRVLLLRPAPPRFPGWLRRRSWLRYYAHKSIWPAVSDGVRSDVVFYTRQWTTGEDVVPAMRRALVDWVVAHPDCQDVDVVYAHFLWPAAAAAMELRARFGWPVAAIARGGEMEQWHATSPHCRRYVEDVLRRVDQPLANCCALRDAAERLVPGSARRTKVVYNGCDAERFHPAMDRPAVRRTLGVGATERVAVFCGGIESVKGVHELATAWRDFSSAHHEWRLVVVGAEIERPLVKTLRALGRRVTLVGRQSETRLIAWLQAADLYLQPSRMEGLANATMEAMAAGLAVIATRVGGQSELIQDGENGWLVPPCDPASLGSALAKAAVSASHREQLGAAARRSILTHFDPHIQASRLTSILESTAASARLASCS